MSDISKAGGSSLRSDSQSAPGPDSNHDDDLGVDASAEELFATIRMFRHAVRRQSARRFPNEPLTQSQAELLRLVGRHPGITVGEAARTLSVASNTLSTIVSELSRKGYLTRNPLATDKRVRQLELSSDAQQDADLSHRTRHALVARALAQLNAADRETLDRGIGILQQLINDIEGAGDPNSTARNPTAGNSTTGDQSPTINHSTEKGGER